MADQDIPAADLTAFLRALELAGETGLPLRAEDISLVESAWSIPDTVVSSHGWVVALKDGQRFHLELTEDDSPAAGREELKLTEMRPHETYPELDDDRGVFWYWPDHINRHLGLTGPSLH